MQPCLMVSDVHLMYKPFSKLFRSGLSMPKCIFKGIACVRD